MKKKLRYLIAALAVAFVAALAPVGVVHAQGSDSYDCSTHFLGLRAWYDGLLKSTTPDKNGECPLKSPEDMDSNKEEGLRKYVWTIIMNVVSMIFGIVGYLAIGFVIWGGFQYILAQGDVAKTMRGKKTVTNAIVGLVIVMTASIIAGTISSIVAGAREKGDTFFLEIFNSAFLWGGIIAGIMIVWGGIQYVTSVGDPAKAAKARNSVLFSAVGLIIIILAATIINTVVNAVQGGN